MLSITLSATPLFSFHLKQVQYATTPSNLDSLEDEAGEERRVGVLKEGVWGRREEKQGKSSKEPRQWTSFQLAMRGYLFSPDGRCFLLGSRERMCFALLQVLCVVSVH